MRARRLAGRAAAAALAACAVLAASDARAQLTAQIPLQFDFTNPGARSMALGAAFVAAADDATAAFANPAGLGSLNLMEVSAEGRYRRSETPFLQGGRLYGAVSGIGADTIGHAVYGTDVNDGFGPTFLSIVVPWGPVTIAGYRHEAARIANTFFSQGTFEGTGRDTALGGTRTIDITNYGGAVGYRVNDRFAVGAGLSVYTFTLKSDFARYGFLSEGFTTVPAGPVDTTKSIATATQRGDEAAATVNAGALWTPGRGFKAGATFRRGPGFGFTQRDFSSISGVELNRSGSFKVPDVYAGGIEWRRETKTSGGAVVRVVRLLADVDRVRYGQLKHDFIDIQAISSGREDQLRISDGTELHAGVEYVKLAATRVFAFRGGAWLDPDHAVRYEPTAQRDALDIRLAAALPGGSTLVHVAGGAGVVLSRHLEVNAAVDRSSRSTSATASIVVRD